MDEQKIPVGYCEYCKERLPLSITSMIKKDEDLTIYIVSCSVCDIVLNLGEDINVE